MVKQDSIYCVKLKKISLILQGCLWGEVCKGIWIMGSFLFWDELFVQLGSAAFIRFHCYAMCSCTTKCIYMFVCYATPSSPFRHLTSTAHTVLLEKCIHFSAHINMMQYLHCMRKPTLHKHQAYFCCAGLDIRLSKLLGRFIQHANLNKSHREFCPH